MARTIHPLPIKLPSQLLSTPTDTNFSHIPGQNASIRFFDPNSLDDYDSLKNIVSNKKIRVWMDDTGKLTKSDYRDWVGNYSQNSFLFAVHDSRVTPEDFNIVRGFVNIYSERSEKFRIKRMVKMGFLPKNINSTHILEISMAAKPQANGEISGSGLMSSALRLSCLQVKAQLGYPKNKDLIIYAYIDPKNIPSLKTIESAGFIRKGKMFYDRNSESESLLYFLSWINLGKKIKNNLSKINLLVHSQITDSHCGPAVVQNLLAYNQIKVSQEEVVIAANAVDTIIDDGLSPSQIALAVNKLAPNLQILFKQNTTARDLNLLIHKYRIPVAINWQGLFYKSVKQEKRESPFDDHGHYSIVVDIDIPQNKITVADQYSEFYKKPRVFSYSWFKSRWWDTDKIGDEVITTKKLIFIIVPKNITLPVCFSTV